MPQSLERVIDWAERVTRIGIRKFFRDFAWTSSNEAVNIATALILAYVYSHYLSQETYGTYKYILSILSALTIFSLPGMADAAQRAIAEGKDAVFWKTFKVRLGWSLLGGLVSAGIGGYYLFFGNPLLGAAFLALAPFVVFIDSFTHYNAILVGRQLFRDASIYNSTVQVAVAIAIVGAILFTHNLLILIIAYAAAFVIGRGIAFRHVAKRYALNTEHDAGTVRYGAHLSANWFLSIAVNQIDSILLFHFLGPIALATFAFAEAAADQGQKGFKLVTTAMAFPKFSATDAGVLKKTLPRKILLSFALTIPLAILLALLVSPVYRFLFPEYVSSIPYAQVMTLWLALMPLRFFSTAVIAKGTAHMIYVTNIVGAVVLIGFLLALIPLFGIWGVILATFCQEMLTNAITVYFFYRL